MAKRQLKGKELKEFRSKVARLKQMGLVSKKVDARTQKSTRYMRDIVEKTFKPVLEGRAVAVKLPSHKIAKEYSKDVFKVRGKKVVVPIEKGASKPVWSPKEKLIKGKNRKYGEKFRQIYFPVKDGDLSGLPRGKKLMYAMPFAHGLVVRRDSFEELEEFMREGYEEPRPGSNRRPFKNWRQYVVVEEIDDEGDTDFE